MPVNQSLRYYRQQFNPEAAYNTQAADSGIISMYNPEQEAQFIDAISQRQQRYDTTNAAVAAEKARIGETETYDLAELTKRLQSFESNINDLVKSKYNGDYGAAANEIAKQIGTERTNPFYHFNKQKVEMSKAYLDAKMKLGSNFLSVGNPLDVKFSDWQQGKTFDFTPVNREDIVKQAATEFSSIADTIINDPQLRSTANGQYILSMIQRGIKDPTALQEFLGTEEGQTMIDNIVQNNPTLSKLPQEQVMSAVFEGAHSAIGKTEMNYMPDQSYMDPGQMAKLSESGGSGFFGVMSPGNGLATGKLIKDDKDGQKLAGLQSFNINSLTPWRMSTEKINELDKIKTNLTTELKSMVLTDTPDQYVDYLSRASKKNIDKMDRSKNITLGDIAFDTEEPKIIMEIQGTDNEGNPVESVITLDAGSDFSNNRKAFGILSYLYRLGNQGSDFNNTMTAWLLKHFPQTYTNSVQ